MLGKQPPFILRNVKAGGTVLQSLVYFHKIYFVG